MHVVNEPYSRVCLWARERERERENMFSQKKSQRSYRMVIVFKTEVIPLSAAT